MSSTNNFEPPFWKTTKMLLIERARQRQFWVWFRCAIRYRNPTLRVAGRWTRSNGRLTMSTHRPYNGHHENM